MTHSESASSGSHESSPPVERENFRPLSPQHRENLRRYLDACDDLNAPTYHEAWGYLFGVACGPESFDLLDWLPGLFGFDEPTFASEGEETSVVDALVAIYAFLERLGEDVVFLPEDVEAVLTDLRPLHEWSRGFESGHAQVVDAWSDGLELLDDSAQDDHRATVALLGLWSTLELDEIVPSVEELPREIASALGHMNSALIIYARMGEAAFHVLNDLGELPIDPEVLEAMETMELAATAPVGRNDPCPCGSGKKFKKCCM